MKRLPVTLKYLFPVYVAGILFFTLFRIVLIYKNRAVFAHIPAPGLILAQALFMGYRFDTVISGYILALPLAVLTIAELAGFLRRKLLLAIHVLLCIIYSFAFFGCAADIPFFLTYNTRLNITILDWTDSPMFMIKMVAEEWSYLAYFLLFLIVSIAFFLILKRIYKVNVQRVHALGAAHAKFIFQKLLISFLAMGILFIGIRGRVAQKASIMLGTAYFSKYDFPNQAGLNPLFTFINSAIEEAKPENKHLHLIDDKTAIANVQAYFHIPPDKRNAAYPIARQERSEAAPLKYNVIIVLMESMSASFMQHGGNTLGLTPVLDHLADNGIYFSNFYSAGIHTFNGIFSTMYSFPALLARHTMVGITIPHYTGLPYIMKKNGYETMYFTTNDPQFDNVGGFVTANNVARVVSQDDYPSSAVVSGLGVPDHYMFDYSLHLFNEQYNRHTPFCALMMTGSNHTPYVIPDNIPFMPKHRDVRGGCVEYADWAIGHFMDTVAKQAWYKNTLFVFVADHGTWEGNTSDGFSSMAYSLNHIPCIIYAPMLNVPRERVNNPGGQIDIFPTVAGLLHLTYTNNTMGVDLLHDTRPYMYFSADDRVGVADISHFYVWQQEGKSFYYSFANREQDILAANTHAADSMQRYAFSMLQATEWLLQHKKTGIVK
ncbi:MAG: sulfatase-like hydrolase/transferase [Taibaiella sp.]|nr:sulfatase-like hydrolase/transferase [Taibaiella sp.]